MGARIRVLPDRVANQIAAGEVIERPAAVVKELLENALDAGATRVAVEFSHGGRARIRVEDNGSGMGPEDARLALQRHATSKLAEAGDLERLHTFGFRGEALPSIASIARFTLRTRPAEDEAGTEIVVHGGRLIHERACGCPVGTAIEVEDLFGPVPARRKFLKTDRTESAHIVQCLRLYALACPSVGFRLVEDGREVFRSPSAPTLLERIAEIFGRETAEALVPLEAVEAGWRISGFISGPGSGRTTRHDLIGFINGRPVSSRTLTSALIEGSRETLPEGRFPRAFVFLDCDPAAVDVNVHPAKREVRFRQEALVRGFVIRSVLAALRGRGAAAPAGAQAGAASGSGLGPGFEGEAGADLRPGPGAWNRGAGFSPWLAEPAGAWREAPAGGPGAPGLPGQADGEARAGGPGAEPVAEGGGAPDVRAGMPPWRYLGLAHGHYALFESPSGLILLDRRSAHERVWFERLRRQFRAGGVPVQRLLLPIPLELDPIAAALLVDHRAFLEAHGFEVAEFGRNFFRIEALPAWLEPADGAPFLRDLVAAFRAGRLPSGQLELAREELARMAAAKAVRLAPGVGETELRVVLAELFATEQPLASPAGRPTVVELTHGEIARRFLAT
jgi:DNA mismatch repair protein MutL